MRFKMTLEHGGYVHTNGDVQIVGVGIDDPEAKHAEQAKCPTDHKHSKDCAKALMDYKPIIQTARKEDDGTEIPEIRAESVRERMAAYFTAYDALPDDPVHVELPKKTVQQKNDKGKLVNVEVEDRDLE